MVGLNVRGISIRVDKLTHSIEDAKTGERFETALERLHADRIHEIKKSHWLFDWKAEVLEPGREVYMLCRAGELTVIQGLVSIEDRGDHLYLHLIENAKCNRGNAKKYVGVAGNMFAYTCKRSLELGYGGYVAFDSKTKLIDHYIKTLGAIHSHAQRLYLDENVAKKLIIRYFSNYETE